MRPWAPIALFVLILGVPGVAGAVRVRRALFAASAATPRLAFTGYSALFFWRR